MFGHIFEFLDKDTRQKLMDLMLSPTDGIKIKEINNLIQDKLVEIQHTVRKLNTQCAETYRDDPHFRNDITDYTPVLGYIALSTGLDNIIENDQTELVEDILRAMNTAFGMGYMAHRNREALKVFEKAFETEEI